MATNGSGSSSRFDSSSIIPLWLNGEEVKTEAVFDVVSPVTQKKLYSCASASEKDAEAAVAAAQEAFKSWSKTKPVARRDIFLKAAEEFARRRDELFAYSSSETGAAENFFGFEFETAVDAFKSVAGLIAASSGSFPAMANEERSALIVKEPYGGNTVVLKGPEASPAIYWALSSVLHAAGLPVGCLNTIYHRPADASRITTLLVSHPAVKKVNFTGSTNVGSILASLAGKHLKPTVMELGGKAPSIVCEDANIENAAMQCALGAFLHAGQICLSTERILVHEKIADQFSGALKGTMEQLFGDKGGFGVPQLVTAAPVEKNKKLLSDAVSKGAGVLWGDVDGNDGKTRMRPVVIEKVTEDMDIYHTESFGPTVSLYVVKNDEEAIRIANDTEYGLSSAVFTQDLRRGLKIAKAIETGAVHINAMSVHDEPALPHGGAKKSGFGRFNDLPGLEEWVRSKVITWQD